MQEIYNDPENDLAVLLEESQKKSEIQIATRD